MTDMKPTTIGVVSPLAGDKLPAAGPGMYPDVKFIARGVGVKALTVEGSAKAAEFRVTGSCSNLAGSRATSR